MKKSVICAVLVVLIVLGVTPFAVTASVSSLFTDSLEYYFEDNPQNDVIAVLYDVDKDGIDEMFIVEEGYYLIMEYIDDSSEYDITRIYFQSADVISGGYTNVYITQNNHLVIEQCGPHGSTSFVYALNKGAGGLQTKGGYTTNTYTRNTTYSIDEIGCSEAQYNEWANKWMVSGGGFLSELHTAAFIVKRIVISDYNPIGYYPQNHTEQILLGAASLQPSNAQPAKNQHPVAPSIYDAYYGVLKSEIDAHELGDKGVIYAALVDFNGDGVQELLLLTFGSDYYFDAERQYPWGFDSYYKVFSYTNKAVLIASDRLINIGATGEGLLIAETSSGTGYLVFTYGDHGAYGDHYYTIRSGIWTEVAYRRSIAIDGAAYEYYDDVFDVNGDRVNKAEFDNVPVKLGIVNTESVDSDPQTVTTLMAMLENQLQAATTTAPPPPPATPQSVNPTASTVYVNGEAKAFDAYLINDSNYFKLRDLAYVLNGTQKQFSVGFDNDTRVITLVSGEPYTIIGGEMEPGDGASKDAIPTPSTIYLDGVVLDLVVYNIGGNNFFKLRDLMEAIDVYVGYDFATNTVSLDTSRGYVAE